MKFLSDYSAVKFTGIDKIFDVSAVLVDFTIPFINAQVTIRWYGALIALGFILAVLFGGRMAYKWKMDLNKMLDVLIYGTFGGIIGARLYYVAFEWEYYSDNLLAIFKLWEGGLAIYGGLIGGIIAAYFTCKLNKLNFYNLLDLAGMSFLIGQGIGRWGNFTNQEAFGTNTDMPWGMWSEKIALYIRSNQGFFEANGFSVDPTKPVHPTFLYESLWCLLGFVILYLICKKYRKFSGQIFLTYGIWYGIGRMIIEGFRTDSLYIGSSTIRVSQLLSALIVMFCIALLVFMLFKYKKNPAPIEGVDFFVEPLNVKKAVKEIPENQAETTNEAIDTKPEQQAENEPIVSSYEEVKEDTEEDIEEKNQE